MTPSIYPTPAATPAAPAAAGSTSSIEQLIKDPSLGSLWHAVASNPQAVLGALGLGYQTLSAPKLPNEAGLINTLTGQAQTANSQAASLEAALQSGVLPPGAQAAIDQATQAAKARVISNYAARGMDTDPKTNASLAQDLNAIDQQAAGAVFAAADQLYSQGLRQAGISSSLYQQILATTSAQNQQTANAVSNFVSALAGSGVPKVA